MTRLALPNVALCSVTSVALTETLWALERCLDQIDFGSALMLTDQPISHPRIACARIEPLQDRQDYSEFILRRLSDYLALPHVLIVQWDSFVLDASKWRNEFLDYDYIGAPWPQFEDNDVGNGGFSLRSKRLLEFTASAEFPGGHPEDLAICRSSRAALDSKGMRIAPRSLAKQFAFERGPERPSFGFHGLFNFPEVLSAAELGPVLKGLDTSLLSGRDGADLIVELARRGQKARAWDLAIRRRAYDRGQISNFRFWKRFTGALIARPQRPSGLGQATS